MTANIWKSCNVKCSWRNECNSDPRSYDYYLTSSANKAREPSIDVNCGLLAQLVERCTDVAEDMGLNPVQAWIFTSGLIFTTI